MALLGKDMQVASSSAITLASWFTSRTATGVLHGPRVRGPRRPGHRPPRPRRTAQGDPRRQLTLAPALQNPSRGRAMAGLPRPTPGVAPAPRRPPPGGLLLRGARGAGGRP